jgi:peptidoglycan/LPS O-acetylase OafA/YrhL
MSTYPVLLLAAGNDPAEVRPGELLFLIVMSAALTSVVLLVFLLLFRDTQKAAAVAVIFVVAFFSYGYVMIFARSHPIGDFMIGRHRYVLPVLFVGSMLLTAAIWRCKGDLSRVLVAVGGAALILTLFNTAQIVQGWSSTSPNTADSLPGTPSDIGDLPDVY